MSLTAANRRRSIVMVAAMACLVLCSPRTQAGTGWGEPVSAPLAHETQKLAASDGRATDMFGMSVSVSGDYAIVGAYQDDARGVDAGTAYIFARNGAGWVQWQQLLALDGVSYDFFGWSVAISGQWAIVGAYGDDSNKGSVHIYRWNGTSWILQAMTVTASDGAAGDEFGYSVSINGDCAIVGALGDDAAASDSGSAYIFRWNGASWTQEHKLTASDGAASDVFGKSVSISGDYAIVGAAQDDDAGSNSGSAYIFKWNGMDWIQQRKLTASDAAANNYFGHSVSISGDYAIVGAYANDQNKGAAYIFLRNGTNWSQQAKLTALDRTSADLFGVSVAISGDYAMVGAHNDDDMGTDSGSAYVFSRRGTNWQEAKLLASDGKASDCLGYSVAISDDYAIAGAFSGDGNATDSGAAYAFKFCPREDLNDDCMVDFTDYAMFTGRWLYGTN